MAITPVSQIQAARIKSVLVAGLEALPADSDSDGARIGGDVVVLAVQIAVLDVEIHVRAQLASDPAAEVLAELVLARVQKVAVDWQGSGIAMPPPGEETVAG